MPTLHRRCPRHHVVYTPPAPCPVCRAAWSAAKDARRGSRHDRGYGSEHEAWAREVLRLHPVCPCGAAARVADHVVPFLSGGAKYDVNNGQGLCLSCSGRKDGGIRR